MASATNFYYTPTTTVKAPTSTLPQSTLTGQIKKLVDTYGSFLKPSQAFEEVMPYEKFAAPNRETFNIWERGMFRPEFETFTLDPFNREYANNAAATNMSMQGNAQNLYKRYLASTEKPYYDQVEGYRNQFEDTTRSQYNELLQQYYDDPTAFRNFVNTITPSAPATPFDRIKSMMPGFQKYMDEQKAAPTAPVVSDPNAVYAIQGLGNYYI